MVVFTLPRLPYGARSVLGRSVEQVPTRGILIALRLVIDARGPGASGGTTWLGYLWLISHLMMAAEGGIHHYARECWLELGLEGLGGNESCVAIPRTRRWGSCLQRQVLDEWWFLTFKRGNEDWKLMRGNEDWKLMTEIQTEDVS